MTIFLLSLGGVPPTGGFFGKFYLFKSAMDVYNGQLLLARHRRRRQQRAISIYYYLRIVTAMYFREVGREMKPIRARGMTARAGHRRPRPPCSSASCPAG